MHVLLPCSSTAPGNSHSLAYPHVSQGSHPSQEPGLPSEGQEGGGEPCLHPSRHMPRASASPAHRPNPRTDARSKSTTASRPHIPVHYSLTLPPSLPSCPSLTSLSHLPGPLCSASKCPRRCSAALRGPRPEQGSSRSPTAGASPEQRNRTTMRWRPPSHSLVPLSRICHPICTMPVWKISRQIRVRDSRWIVPCCFLSRVKINVDIQALFKIEPTKIRSDDDSQRRRRAEASRESSRERRPRARPERHHRPTPTRSEASRLSARCWRSVED